MDIWSIIEQSFREYGYAIVFFSAFFESLIGIGLLLPGSFIVLFGGYFAQTGELSVYLIGFLAFWGMFLGDVVNYCVGRISITAALKNKKWFSWILKNHNNVSKQLQRYGMLAVFYSHILGYTRSIVCFSAGFLRYPFEKYVVSVFIASSLWGALFVGLGYFLGTTTSGLKDLSTRVAIIAWIVLFALLALKIIQNFIIQRIGKGK